MSGISDETPVVSLFDSTSNWTSAKPVFMQQVPRSAAHDLEGLVVAEVNNYSASNTLLDIGTSSSPLEKTRASQPQPQQDIDHTAVSDCSLNQSANPIETRYCLDFGSDLLAKAREDILQQSKDALRTITAQYTVSKKELDQSTVEKKASAEEVDAHKQPAGVTADVKIEESKAPKVYKPAYYAQQAADEEKKSHLRARITELEEQNKDYKKRLRYEGIVAEENEKLRIENRRLAAFELAVEATKTEMESLRRSEDVAAEQASKLQVAAKKQQEDWKMEKQNLLYRLVDTAEQLNKLKQSDEGMEQLNKDLQARNAQLEDELEQLASEANAKLTKKKNKIAEQTSEIESLRSDNGILIARNVELQKGADSRGPRVYDLRTQLESLKARLDKQFDINHDLAREKEAAEARISELQRGTAVKTSASVDATSTDAQLKMLETEKTGYKLCLREAFDALGWELHLNMTKIEKSFDRIHQKLFARFEVLRQRSELAKTVNVTDLKEVFLKTLNAEYNRLKSTADEV